MSVAGDMRVALARIERIDRIDRIDGPAAPANAWAPAPSAAAGRRFGGLVAQAYVQLARHAGQEAGVDPDLVAAVAGTESGFDPGAVSRAGALGLMQLMPATAAALGVADPRDPMQNVRGGAAYLHDLLQRFSGDVALAVAAYNAGPAAVERFGGVPPFAETRAYVARVLAAYRACGVP